MPRLLWEFHTIDIEYGKLVLTMNDLKNKFDTINIAVALACDGNHRKELNMIKRSKGFNRGSGAVSCAYWKGPLLRDFLIAAGIPEFMPSHAGKRCWVNFEGADDPSEGKYATCIPLQYAMDATNDVILAYEMNDVPLPPNKSLWLALLGDADLYRSRISCQSHDPRICWWAMRQMASKDMDLRQGE